MTQDARNVSANMPRRHEDASLSFDFENKPGQKPKADSAPAPGSAKPNAPASTPAKSPAATPAPAKAPMPAQTSASAPAASQEPASEPESKPASEPAKAQDQTPAAPKKQYGLPENYSVQTAKTNDLREPVKNADASGSLMKQKLSDGLAAAKKARTERRKQKAREAAIARAAREQAEEEAARRRAEAERLAAEAAAKAEYQAALDEAVEAEIAKEKAEAAEAKKAAKKEVKAGKKPKTVTSSKKKIEKKVEPRKADTKKADAKSDTKKDDAKKTAAAAPAKKAPQKKAKKNKKKKGKKPPKKRSKFRWILSVFEILIALAILGGVAGGAYAAITISQAPEINPNAIYNTLDVSTHIYDDKGRLTDDIYYSENRDIIKYEELPENLKNAFIAIEDKTFWTHKGFNFRRIFGAILSALKGGGEISGTSTITQQLARNVFLPEEKSIRSIKRKIIEMYYAYVIEDQLSKEEILTAYLNTIYLGYGCYGVDTAARKYFSKDVEDLKLKECAALAALPQAPGVYALLITEKDDRETTTKIRKGLYANDISRDRRYLVLDLMAEQGYITQKKAEKAKKPLDTFINPSSTKGASTISSFKDYLLETVKHDLMEKYNISDDEATKMIYSKGLNIYSTLNRQAQSVITKEFKDDSNFPSAIDGESPVEAAMVIVEVGTGQIKAMVGTRHSKGEMLFNRATSPRQPGSSIKPLAVYSAALQKSYEYQQAGKLFKFTKTGYDSQGVLYWGNYITVASGVTDEKMTVKGKVWPQNFSRSYSGYKTFRQAIQLSINTCAVKILAQVGIDYSVDMVKKYGISTFVDDTSEPYNDVNLAALALGAMTVGATPLDMALAYATFPNGGVRNSGICYTKVTDSDGKVLLEGVSEETKVLDEGVAFIMTDVLQSVVTDGIAGDARIEGEEVGGKTGTTDDTWDIWFDGFTARSAAALWIGTDDNVALNSTSATAAALWSRIMSQVNLAYGGTYPEQPSNVIIKNGEYFTNGTQPPDPPPEEKKDKDKDKSSKDKKSDSSKTDSSKTDSSKKDKKD